MSNQVFGNWGVAPKAVGAPRIATPIGEQCFLCKETILADDVGEMITVIDIATTIEPFHRGCTLLRIFGADFGLIAPYEGMTHKAAGQECIRRMFHEDNE